MRFDTPLDGGCFCGAIRYRIGAVFDAGYCHCSICRRISGAPVSAWANIPADEFALLKGTPNAFATSAHGQRHFCGDCGGALFWAEDGGANVSVGLGTLDDPEAVKPAVHICGADRLSWFAIDDDLPRFPHSRLSHPDRRPLAT
jgi:hypothetical protein